MYPVRDCYHFREGYLMMNIRYSCFSFCVFISLLIGTESSSRAVEFRTIDGAGNHLTHPAQGQAFTPLVRIRDVLVNPLPGFDPGPLAPAYEDGIDTPRGILDLTTPAGVGTSRLPNPRDISNAIVAQGSRSVLNPLRASDWLWQWGQFIDHDIALEEPSPTSDPFLIPVTDSADSLFNPNFPFLPFRRNDPAPGTGAGTGVPREQVNKITSYIDGSNVYGSDLPRADFLRTFEGGKLKTTTAANGETLLPFNRATNPFPNANPPVTPGSSPADPEALYLAGDIRANEQLGLTAVHTMFLREHNRLAEGLSQRADLHQLVTAAGLDANVASDVDEYVYQMSRKAVGAEIQAITYNEFLPMLVGHDVLPTYQGYDANVNATLSNEFANAAYRVGHTLLSPEIQLADLAGNSLGSVALRDAFFDPSFTQANGVDSLLKGLSMHQAQDVDALVIDEVRNFLFEEGNGGLDLAAVNIQRGRDHGLPSYNDMRRGLGLAPRVDFSEITSDLVVTDAIASIYDTIEDVDLWLGALAEDGFGDGLVGELLGTILVDQFTRLRDGDRFFHAGDVDLLALFPSIGLTSLSEIIVRNTAMASMPTNVFVIPEPSTILLGAFGVLMAGVCQRGLVQKTHPTGFSNNHCPSNDNQRRDETEQ